MDIKPIFLTSEIHPKKWGEEQWLCNNEEFCGKILKFKKGAQFSAHQHVKKREVFYILKGSINLMTINPVDASQQNVHLFEGDVVEIPRLLVHQITALESSQIIEFSTHHDEADSLRVLPGDSQK
jgi:mannose-6-phosphate isomerase-like protein (cupin superfamily)